MGILFVICVLAGFAAVPAAADDARSQRPRAIISTDFPPLDVIPGGAGHGPPEKRSDPDDVQSMVRFLLYANVLDVEGLVASAATFANIATKHHILDILKLYEHVEENLRRRDPNYPTADELRSVTWEGRSNAWGKPADQILGEDQDTEASEAIIRVVNKPDPRPVWVCVWGGPREVAQAIWKVRATCDPAELKRFLGKLRIYLIAKQDGTAQWLLDEFPDLFVIVSMKNYQGMFCNTRNADPKLADLEWINANIREGHGPLGAVYPPTGFSPDRPGQQEGDTPSFLYLVSAAYGMSDSEKPDEGSWGGKFVRPDQSKSHWYDDPRGTETVSRWRPEAQADFARRADWMLP